MSEPRHLCAPLIERAARDPEGVFAIVCARGRERTIDHRAVLTRALELGGAIADAGVTRGDLVIIVMEHGADLYAGFLGCLLRGFVPSFLPPLTSKQDPDIFRRSMAALFERIAPAAVLTSRTSQPHVPVGRAAVLLADDVAAGERADAAAEAAALLLADPDATAFLQHSSGTTGLKKGVMLSHRAVHDQIALYAGAIGAVPGDVVASWLPLYHDMGLITGFLLPAVRGLPIVSLDALEWVVRPTSLLDAMARHRAAFAWMPDFAFHHVRHAAPGTGTSVRSRR
jgi:acyl-CoA synthetase (AMP-forming)/AMP-acid ligase II